MKKLVINIIRRPPLQFLWAFSRHFSLVAMNYYGGSALTESGELDLLKYLGNILSKVQQPIVFDVGANKGQYLKNALTLLPSQTKFYCFEPSNTAFDHLHQFAGGLANVVLLNLGVGEEQSKQKLRFLKPGSALASLHAFNNNDNALCEEIELVAIDDFCAQNNISHIDFLKMDIEGHELFALKGAMRMISERRISMIQFELGPANIGSRTYLKDFYNILGDRYDVYRVVCGGIIPIGQYSEENEVFLVANYFARLKDSKVD